MTASTAARSSSPRRSRSGSAKPRAARARRSGASSRTKHGVTVLTKRLGVRAKHAIVAIPPTLAGRIDYRPDLPPFARPAHPAPPAGQPDEGARGLRPSLLARRRAERDRGLNRRLRQRDLRRLAAGRQPGSRLRLCRRRQGEAVQRDAGRPARGADRLPASRTSSAPGRPSPIDYFESNWARRALDARLPGGDRRSRASTRPMARRCASPSAASTGPGPRPRPTGTATWTARFAPASARRRRCSEGRSRRGARLGCLPMAEKSSEARAPPSSISIRP